MRNRIEADSSSLEDHAGKIRLLNWGEAVVNAAWQEEADNATVALREMTWNLGVLITVLIAIGRFIGRDIA
jgi:hypothetical protein